MYNKDRYALKWNVCWTGKGWERIGPSGDVRNRERRSSTRVGSPSMTRGKRILWARGPRLKLAWSQSLAKEVLR